MKLVQNPIIGADMPDPDLLRVGDTYYMVSTTMFYMPGGPILRSRDLCRWEIVSYIFETLEDDEAYHLQNGKNAYGKGQWATSLAHHNGRFYACFVSWDEGKTYLYSSDDIEKSGWERIEIPEVFHDMSFLFWKDRAYLVYGNGEIGIVELEPDLSGLRQGGLRRLLFKAPADGMRLRCEGCRAVVRDGMIYLLFIDWPQQGLRRVVCYRSGQPEGPYECRVLLHDDGGMAGHGVAQGTLIQGEDGEWYGMFFQDRGAVGRIPYLMPVVWEEGWPVPGTEEETGSGSDAIQKDGKRIAPVRWEMPEQPGEIKSGETQSGGTQTEEDREAHTPECAAHRENAEGKQHENVGYPVCGSDSFARGEDSLPLFWQWNHNPDPSCWSLTRRPGWLRLTAGQPADSLLRARNTLTQRTMEPGCVCEVTLDVSGMKEGDYAGLCALQGRYGQIGAAVRGGRTWIRTVIRSQNEERASDREEWLGFDGTKLFLRVIFDYRDGVDLASFYWKSETEGSWQKLGETLPMIYTLDVFVGYRIGLFCYSPEKTGGYADFREFTMRDIGES
ncbi:MAG: glycoside hydrolase 43 family protein [Eubacteriales bacterium]|nr:glycoside hydrolase 43 family protein [Eubacteriales bacterium]